MKRDILLIIDDSDLDLSILNEIFKSIFRVKCASNVAEAMQFVRENYKQICAVILDICLGKKERGFHVLQQIHDNQLTHKLPIILITSDAHEEYVYRGIEKGAVDFLAKPVNPHSVQERVCQIVKGSWPKGETILDFHKRAEDSSLHGAAVSAKDETARWMEEWEQKLGMFCRLRPSMSVHKYKCISKIAGILAKTYAGTVSGHTLTSVDIENIRFAALFYDIGLFGIPDSVLQAPEGERDEALYSQHVYLGKDFFTGSEMKGKLYEYCLNIAYWHHKNYDGSGYPAEGTKVKVPLCAQFVHTALRCDYYARFHLNDYNLFDEILEDLKKEAGKILSEEMWEMVRRSRKDLSGVLHDLYLMK